MITYRTQHWCMLLVPLLSMNQGEISLILTQVKQSTHISAFNSGTSVLSNTVVYRGGSKSVWKEGSKKKDFAKSHSLSLSNGVEVGNAHNHKPSSPLCFPESSCQLMVLHPQIHTHVLKGSVLRNRKNSQDHKTPTIITKFDRF